MTFIGMLERAIMLARDSIVAHFDRRFDQLQERIRMDQATLAQTLTDLSTQLAAATTQITTDITELEAAITAGNGTTPEVDAALAALKTSLSGLQAAIPDPSTLPGAPAPAPAPAAS